MVAQACSFGVKVLKSNVGMLKEPYKLNFAVTYRCNSRCKTCGIWLKRPSDELSADEIELLSAKNRFFSWVNLTGGEPFLRKDLHEIASSFKRNMRHLYLLNLTTNGLKPKAVVEAATDILRVGIPRLTAVVSLDGYRELHDRIRGVEGSWKRALETFAALKQMAGSRKDFRVFFGYTLSGYNAGEFRKTLLSVRERMPYVKPADFHVNLFHTSTHYYSNSRVPFAKGAEREAASILGLKRSGRLDPVSFMEKNYLRLAGHYLRTGGAALRCKSLESSIFLDPTGEVYPCTIFGEKLGNIRETGYLLSTLIHSANAAEIRKQAGIKCPHCWTPCEAYSAILGNLGRVLWNGDGRN